MVLLVNTLLATTACSAPKPTFHEESTPKTLSAWGMLTHADQVLRPADGVIAFDLNTPLFTDYAHKLRTVWLPANTTAHYSDSDTFEFPVGTVITKTFFYPVDPEREDHKQVLRTPPAAEGTANINLASSRMIETRVLAHRSTGWVALPYVWNEEQTEATFEILGAMVDLELIDPDYVGPESIDSANLGTANIGTPNFGTEKIGSENQGHEPLNFIYGVPDLNQCSGCHRDNLTTKEIRPIGTKSRHLNRNFSYPQENAPATVVNQLTHWQERGILDQLPDEQTSIPANAAWNGNIEAVQAALNNAPLITDMARSYLDINCSHCHNPSGPADTSALFLEPDSSNPFRIGICKPPVAAGRGTGGRLYGIYPGSPEQSIMHYRLNSVRPEVAMPELGRSTVHAEGVLLVDSWISNMPGDC